MGRWVVHAQNAFFFSNVFLLWGYCRPKVIACWSGDDPVMVALATRLPLHDKTGVDVDARLGVVPGPAGFAILEIRAVAAAVGRIFGVEDIIDLA